MRSIMGFVLTATCMASACATSSPPQPTPAPPKAVKADVPLSSSVEKSASTGNATTAEPRASRAVRNIDLRGGHLCALLTDGSVECIRGGDSVAIAGLTDATDLSVGPGYACVTTKKGHVACWAFGSDYRRVL